MLATSTLPYALAALLALPASSGAPAQDDLAARVEARGAAFLQELVEAGVPGASAAVVLPDGQVVAFAAGLRESGKDEPLETSDRLLAGSVGKTFVTAVAHRLVVEGELSLDARAASYFDAGDEAPAWIQRVPNAGAVTVRQLLRHQSGIPRYVFQPEFFDALVDDPERVWRPEECLAYVFDQEALFAPGEGWAYSDTNYLMVGLVIERVTRERFYDLARAWFVEPLELSGTVASDGSEIPGLVQGHVMLGRQFGVAERSLEDGRATYNLQFEWCGGGWASTPSDLARWAGLLYGGAAMDGPYLETLLETVEAPGLGAWSEYGLGVMRQTTELGELRGHTGFMPGYVTSMGTFPEKALSVAIQLNTDRSPRPMDGRLLVELARAAAEAVEGR